MTSAPEIGQSKLFDIPQVSLTLADRFLVPPFSVLEARAGYWARRKREWLDLGICSELGRDEKLLGFESIVDVDAPCPKCEGRGIIGDNARTCRDCKGNGKKYGGYGSLGTTSVFDPVVCELVYRWFCPEAGRVLDPFAGGSVRGIVAAHLGLEYVGIDLRAEQVAANNSQRQDIGVMFKWPTQPRWIWGDSRELGTLVPDAYQSFDLIFSCPPYYDLEVYSDDPRDLSNAGDYPEFLAAYQTIVFNAVGALRPDRFAAFVVGEVRAKDGSYVGLVPDTIRAFEQAGARLYNEAILVTPLGSTPVRTSAQFGAGRKLGKTHQNLLVFCKGDPKAAAAALPLPEEVAVEYGGATWKADSTVELPA